MPLASTAGGVIAFSRSGQGSPLVLLLPQSAGPVGVAPLAEGLASEFSVIRYDQRGTGQSPPPTDPEAISMAARAQEVADLLAALGIGRAHLVCHSTGCGIGLAFASAHPEWVISLALIAPWSHGDPFLTDIQTLRIAAAEKLGARDYACFNASLLFPPDYRREHADGFAQLAATAAPVDAAQVARRLHAILAFDSRPLLSRIASPALVISADNDPLMPAWFGQEIAAGLPDAHYVEMRGGGHMLPETRTPEVLALLLPYLKDKELVR